MGSAIARSQAGLGEAAGNYWGPKCAPWHVERLFWPFRRAPILVAKPGCRLPVWSALSSHLMCYTPANPSPGAG